jgi:hypothetical protein
MVFAAWRRSFFDNLFGNCACLAPSCACLARQNGVSLWAILGTCLARTLALDVCCKIGGGCCRSSGAVLRDVGIAFGSTDVIKAGTSFLIADFRARSLVLYLCRFLLLASALIFDRRGTGSGGGTHSEVFRRYAFHADAASPESLSLARRSAAALSRMTSAKCAALVFWRALLLSGPISDGAALARRLSRRFAILWRTIASANFARASLRA